MQACGAWCSRISAGPVSGRSTGVNARRSGNGVVKGRHTGYPQGGSGRARDEKLRTRVSGAMIFAGTKDLLGARSRARGCRYGPICRGLTGGGVACFSPSLVACLLPCLPSRSLSICVIDAPGDSRRCGCRVGSNAGPAARWPRVRHSGVSPITDPKHLESEKTKSTIRPPAPTTTPGEADGLTPVTHRSWLARSQACATPSPGMPHGDMGSRPPARTRVCVAKSRPRGSDIDVGTRFGLVKKKLPAGHYSG